MLRDCVISLVLNLLLVTQRCDLDSEQRRDASATLSSREIGFQTHTQLRCGMAKTVERIAEEVRELTDVEKLRLVDRFCLTSMLLAVARRRFTFL